MNPFKKSHFSLSIYLTAGYPNPDSLKEQLLFLQDSGVDFVEIGIPFSDPVADGEVIQEVHREALLNGMHLERTLDQVQSVHTALDIPLVIMTYFNPVYAYGLEKFLRRCQQLNIRGLIIPDLPFEYYQTQYRSLFESHRIPLIHLITPSTEDERIQTIAQASETSFVYLTGQNSTTGIVENQVPDFARYEKIRSLCDKTPLYIGFGIRTKAQMEALKPFANGVIVGSAYLKALKSGDEKEFLHNLIC